MKKEADTTFKAPELEVKAYHNWLEERAKEEKQKHTSRFVTLSRDFGCDGFPVAEKVRDLFNAKHGLKWMIFTHQILEKMAGDEELGSGLIHEIDGGRYSFVNWFIDGLVPPYLQSVQSKVFTRLRTLILNLSEKGNCIFVGGGAQIITGELDPAKFSALHVRLYAPVQWRVKSVMKKFNLDQQQAEKFLMDQQFKRNQFIEDFTGKSPADPNNYNLMLNGEKCDQTLSAQTILFQAEQLGFFKK